MLDRKSWWVLIVILIILLVLWYFSRPSPTPFYGERFTSSPYQSERELDSYYRGSTAGVQDYLVDNMTCHPSCCGDQWPVPFDGLTGPEVEQCIENRGKPGPFVRTNYTCANGINGVGCPCINKDAYLFLVNHGANARTKGTVEPSFLIRNDVNPTDYQESPWQQVLSKKSMFVDSPRMNDLELQRSPISLQNVQSYGAQMPSSVSQLNNMYPVN